MARRDIPGGHGEFEVRGRAQPIGVEREPVKTSEERKRELSDAPRGPGGVAVGETVVVTNSPSPDELSDEAWLNGDDLRLDSIDPNDAIAVAFGRGFDPHRTRFSAPLEDQIESGKPVHFV